MQQIVFFGGRKILETATGRDIKIMNGYLPSKMLNTVRFPQQLKTEKYKIFIIVVISCKQIQNNQNGTENCC